MIKSDDCILIMGRRGCGKSFLSKNIQKLWPRKIILDTLGEYSDGLIVSSFEDFSKQLLINKNNPNFTIIYQFDPESEISELEFNHILRVSYYFGNVQVVIEEIQSYSSPHVLPHWLKTSLLTGRHQHMSLLFTTQRPGELNKTILSQCAHIFCGNIVEGNDLRYVSSFLRQSSDRLISLPDRKFLYFNKDGVTEISNDFN